ncbi:hypothetical protein HBH64_031370 [Parastagonospora nodorum]|nr:hypothetical protein HBH54_051220 [Parastagonospora nodorum]KAH4038847.1 hypothetical protein HBI09_040660 [Parastagonospora nodorum]KAH4054626.1 hypothetical protein HBH49_065200 [Parastagonospora nodorum]KAH4124447.1 hypothetical protein HBH45_239690 [Parastagonospora nodorum]KAH4130890.1 hypothetical protein HBH47_013340 [Parastagonospora nodorum]
MPTQAFTGESHEERKGEKDKLMVRTVHALSNCEEEARAPCHTQKYSVVMHNPLSRKTPYPIPRRALLAIFNNLSLSKKHQCI